MTFAQRTPFRQIGRCYSALLGMSDSLQILASEESSRRRQAALEAASIQQQGAIVAVCDRLDAVNATVADLTVAVRAATAPTPTVAIHAIQGFRFLLDSTSLVDRMVHEHGEWEGDQVRQLRQLAEHFRGRENVAFLDLGSYWGYYSFMMWQTGLFNRIYAFDADVCNFAQLQANIFLNKMEEIVDARNVAVSDGPGILTLQRSRSHSDGNRGAARILPAGEADFAPHTRPIQAVAIDDALELSGGHLVIKMDVEAHEAKALNGLRRTIRSNQVFLQVEIYREQSAEVMPLIQELGLRQVASIYPDFYFTNVPVFPL